MKNRVVFILLILAAVIPLAALGQDSSGGKPTAVDIWPGYWYGNDEFTYQTLPVGGWNTIGAFSLRSLAMGETFLSATDGTAGYLNPALLSTVKAPRLSLDYRWSENAYRAYPWPQIIPLVEFASGYGESRTYKGKSEEDLASIALVLPFDGWAVSASYFRFQDYRIPRIDGLYGTGLEFVEGSGGTRGVNLAVSARVARHLSLGVSASYLFGDIRRVQVLTPVYIWFDGTVSPSDPGTGIPPIWYWPSIRETYHLDLKGASLSFGAVFEPSERWTLGLTLRPPFAMDIDARMESLWMDGASVPSVSWERSFEKQPFLAVGSVLYRASEAFELTADVSFWGWSGAASDYPASSYYPYSTRSFRDVVKLNVGAEYKVGLPFRSVKDLFLRAGYIHDPQPYRYDESYSRDLLCAGTALAVGPLEVGVSAKIAISARELRRFRANIFQAGAVFRF